MTSLIVPLLLCAISSASTLTGVVADKDIYHGERLVGATVWLTDGTTTTTDGSGVYTFDGLSSGTYTAYAIADGFYEGSCSKELESSGTFWCSIALEPDPGGDDTGDPPDDTGDPPDDTGDPTVEDTVRMDTAVPGAFPPGDWVPLYACSAKRAVPAAWLALLAGLGLAVRRREG